MQNKTLLDKSNISIYLKDVEGLKYYLIDYKYKLYKMVYTSGRKPRKSDKGSYSYIVASNYTDATIRAKEVIQNLGMQFKEKFMTLSLEDIKNIKGEPDVGLITYYIKNYIERNK